MDFKSLMSKQINKSKPTAATNASKYQRRGEAEKEREAKYAEEQAKAEQDRLDRQEKKRKFDEAEAEREAIREEKKRRLAEESKARREAEEIEEDRLKRKRLGLPELLRSNLHGDKPDIPDEELRAKLAALDQDEVVDGEDHEARLTRFYDLTAGLARKTQWYSVPVPTTLEPLPADQIILPDKPPGPADTEGYLKLHRQISSYINFVLGEWSKALSARSIDDAQSSTGISATKNLKIALDDLKPLMRRLEAAVGLLAPSKENSGLSPLPHEGLLVPLVEILHLTQKRHYRDAVDGYLRMSIGKAAWPIGVTMVGIHERSAREKLHEDGKDREVAHIMSDERTRKWLQSLKRCITFAQTRWEVYDVGQLMG